MLTKAAYGVCNSSLVSVRRHVACTGCGAWPPGGIGSCALCAQSGSSADGGTARAVRRTGLRARGLRPRPPALRRVRRARRLAHPRRWSSGGRWPARRRCPRTGNGHSLAHGTTAAPEPPDETSPTPAACGECSRGGDARRGAERGAPRRGMSSVAARVTDVRPPVPRTVLRREPSYRGFTCLHPRGRPAPTPHPHK